MTDDQLAEAKSIFQAVIELPAEERQKFLSQRCGHDRELRALVERLLEHHEGGIGDFLEPPDVETQVAAEPPEPLPQRIGPFEIIRKLGAGGMGTVYLARQEKPQRTVALKVVRLSVADALTLKRFDFEIDVLGQLNHPGIAQIYEAGTDKDGTPFFAMEYVPGEPLLKHAENRGLSLRERLELLAQVCDAVHYAHEKGVIHRDLKPGNITVAEAEGSPPQPKILDFGVARAMGVGLRSDSLQTRTGTLVGTLAYMSPEQVSGRSEELDARTDVYQLGVILFELLAGRLPYDVEGLSVTEAMRVIKENEPPQLGSLDSNCRGDITTIVGKALEKDPRRRYATAADLAADIRRHLADEPIMARPPSATYRLRKLLRRRRTLVGAYGLGLILAAVVATAWWWSNQQSASPAEIRATRIAAEDFGFREVFLALSPDGRSIAYTEGYDLHLAVIGSGAVETILEWDESQILLWVEWHPDGKRLLVESWLGDRYKTWLMDVETKRTEPILESDGRTFPSVSPDGRSLAYIWGNQRELRIGPINGGGGSTILRVGELEVLSPPVWAPDGTHLAYTVEYTPERFPPCTLEITDLDGNRSPLIEDRRINQSNSGMSRICWLPDGRLIYNKHIGQSGGELVVVEVDIGSGRLRREARQFYHMEGCHLVYPSASADGKRIAFRRERMDHQMVQLDISDGAQGAEPRPLCVASWVSVPGAWSADGQRIFFARERKTGDADVYVRDLQAPREEPFVESPQWDEPQCLTPDGSHLLYLQDRDLISIPVTGGESRRILSVEGENPIVGVRCAEQPDSTCVIAVRDGAELAVRPFRLDGEFEPAALRVEVDVDEDSGMNTRFDLSPDGSRIVVTEWPGRIRVLDLDTGESRELLNEWVGHPQRVYWSRSGATLYLTGMDGLAPYWVASLDLEGRVEVLWESENTWANRAVPSRDDRSLAIQTVRCRGDIWMIEGF